MRVLLGCLVMTTPLLGQPQLDPAQAQIERIQLLGSRSISAFRRQVRPQLTARQQVIEEAIQYRVAPSVAVNGVAYIDDSDRRRIDIGAGLLQVFEFMSVALVMPRWTDRECAATYVDHIIDTVVENGRRHSLGVRLSPVYDPLMYGARNQPVCAGLSFARMQADPEGTRNQVAALGGSIRWFLAHELAHHVLGHVESPLARSDLPQAELLKLSRTREQEADAFAFKVSVYDGPGSIAFAFPAYLVVAGLGGDVENEALETHPAGLRRIRLLIEALETLPEDDEEFADYLTEEGLDERWDEFIEEMMSQLRLLGGH